MPRSTKLFLSYSPKDEELKEALVKHLAILQRQKVIDAWHDREILPGADLEKEIDDNLDSANVILLLISSDFLSGSEKQLEQIMERYQAGETHVIPVILRSCDWQSDPVLAKFKVLPKDGKPIVSWSDQDEAFLDVVQEIRSAVKFLLTQQPNTRERGRFEGNATLYSQEAQSFLKKAEEAENQTRTPRRFWAVNQDRSELDRRDEFGHPAADWLEENEEHLILETAEVILKRNLIVTDDDEKVAFEADICFYLSLVKSTLRTPDSRFYYRSTMRNRFSLNIHLYVEAFELIKATILRTASRELEREVVEELLFRIEQLLVYLDEKANRL